MIEDSPIGLVPVRGLDESVEALGVREFLSVSGREERGGKEVSSTRPTKKEPELFETGTHFLNSSENGSSFKKT